MITSNHRISYAASRSFVDSSSVVAEKNEFAGRTPTVATQSAAPSAAMTRRPVRGRGDGGASYRSLK
jgi:hypothetical protein